MVEPADTTIALSPWEKHRMAVDDVTQRLQRIVTALTEAEVPYALVGGQAVALWVATKDPAAVRTTKDVDILLDRDDLPVARAAARSAGFDYFETMGVGMFLDQGNPNPRLGIHICWAGEKIRPAHAHETPPVAAHESLGQLPVVSVLALVKMKLQAGRDQDRVHLRDMIDVGLVDREVVAKLPADLRPEIERLLGEQGR